MSSKRQRGKLSDAGKPAREDLFRGTGRDRQNLTILTCIMRYKAQVETHDISNKAAVAGLGTSYFVDTENHHGRTVREYLETQKRDLMKEYKPPTLELPHDTPQNYKEGEANKTASQLHDKVEDAYYECILHHLLRYLADEHLPSDLQDKVEKMWRDVRPMGRNEAQSTYNRHVVQIAKFVNEMADAQNSNVLNMKLLMGENPPAALLADDAGDAVLRVLPKNQHRELNLRRIEDEEIKAKLMANCMDIEFVSTFRMMAQARRPCNLSWPKAKREVTSNSLRDPQRAAKAAAADATEVSDGAEVVPMVVPIH